MTLPRRYDADVRGELAGLRLRALAGVVALGAGAWLVALPYALPRFFGVAGVALGALWIARWWRAEPRAGEAYLELGTEDLVRHDAGRHDVIPWREIVDVDVDEDRLVVRIERARADPILIEPRYGLALYALRDELRLVWRSVLR